MVDWKERIHPLGIGVGLGIALVAGTISNLITGGGMAGTLEILVAQILITAVAVWAYGVFASIHYEDKYRTKYRTEARRAVAIARRARAKEFHKLQVENEQLQRMLITSMNVEPLQDFDES